MKVLFYANGKRVLLGALVIGILLLTTIPLYAAQATLAWNPNNPTPDGYQVFRRVQGSGYNYNAPVWSGSSTTCSVNNLADNTTYYFVVRAYADDLQSENSNEVSYRYEPPTPTYTISASAGAHGSISPGGQVSIDQGASRNFTITPAYGYRVANVLVDGSSVGAVTSYRFSNVSANHTISASFAADTPDTYTITATAGVNGSITPSGQISVTAGGSRTFSIQPDSSCHVANVVVNGQSMGPISSYTFTNVSANCTISASFAQSTSTYTIAASAGAGGTISPSGSSTVDQGGSQAYTITAHQDYRIKDVRVDGQSMGDISFYRFSNVTADHVISASFEGLNSDPAMVIIDDGEPGTTAKGNWGVSSAPDPYGRQSLYSWNGDDTYAFQPGLTGKHEVALWWTAHSSRGTAVPVQIWDGDTLLETVIVDQQQGGGVWNILGSYDFNEDARVVIVSEGGCVTSADAVRFEAYDDQGGGDDDGGNDDGGSGESLIIDNGDPGTAADGNWKPSSAPNAYGQQSLYSWNGNDTYIYQTTLTGTHEVALWWTAHGSRGTAVPIQVWDGGTLLQVVYVDQQQNGGQWNVLGSYNFNEDARVVIVSEGGCTTSADAVSFSQ